MNAITPIKDKATFLDKDPTNDWFGLLTLDDLYEMVSQCCTLHDGVPEDVHSYFNAVVTLYLYGWLYYPFYMMASERSFFAIEMALRKRLPASKKLDKKSRDRRGLADLLTEAKDAGLLHDEQFPSLENRRVNAEAFNRQIAQIMGRHQEIPQEPSYVDFLVKTLPQARNRFAHPHMQMRMPPGPMLDSLITAAEVINQLWPKPEVLGKPV